MDDWLRLQLLLLAIELGVTIVGLMIAIVAHEVGHAVAGYAIGLRVARIGLGPLEIRGYDRPRVRLVPSLHAGVVLVPSDPAAGPGPLRWSLLISTAAGPLAGIAFGAIVVAQAGGLRLPAPLAVMEVAGQLSLLLGVLNLLPIPTREGIADGQRILALLLRGRQGAQILAGTLLLGEALSGRRARDWDPSLLGVMERSPEDQFARMLLYSVAMDRGEVETAGRQLDAAVALRNDHWNATDAVLFNEAAYFAARHRGDARAARTWLGLADSWAVVDYMRLRAEAAVLCAEGRPLEGRQRAVAGLAALERARRRDADLSREQLEELARGASTTLHPLTDRLSPIRQHNVS